MEEEHSKCCIQESWGKRYGGVLVPNGAVSRFVESSEVHKGILRKVLIHDLTESATEIILTTDAANDLNNGRQEIKT